MLRVFILLVAISCTSTPIFGNTDSLFNAIANPASQDKDLRYREKLSLEGIKTVDELTTVNEYYQAQRWLNKISELYHNRQPSVVNFYISSRQSEVYYYENLFQLGLEEALNALNIAKRLNDSFLIADACNFAGLHQLNMGRLQEAVNYFTQGLQYFPARSIPGQYLPVSRLHHIYGNLGEAYEKMQEPALAYRHYLLSLREAQRIQIARGTAVAYGFIGKMLLMKGQTDSAETYFRKSLAVIDSTPEKDVYLINQAYLARCAIARKNPTHARQLLDTGFSFLRNNPEINTLYSINFLSNAAIAYRTMQDHQGTIMAYEQLMSYDSLRNHINYTQVQHILKNNMNYENRLLKMEVNESRQRQEIATWRFYIAIAIILLLLTALLAYRYYFIQKIKLASLRNTISRDLHDDVGATLSSIHIFGSVVERALDIEPEKARTAVKYINASSRELVDKMGDIVWAIDANTSHEKALSYKIKNFFYDLMHTANINCSYKIDEQLEQKLTNPQVRKNLLLIAKEALNNIIKYSTASNAEISLFQDGKQIILKVHDNGRGFDAATAKKGNGIHNMIKRAHQLGGECSITTKPENGVMILCSFPLTIIRDKL